MKRINLKLIDGSLWLATSPDDKAVYAEASNPEQAVALAVKQHKELVRLRKVQAKAEDS